MCEISFSEGESGIASSGSSMMFMFAYLLILFRYSFTPSSRYFSFNFPQTYNFNVHDKIPFINEFLYKS